MGSVKFPLCASIIHKEVWETESTAILILNLGGGWRWVVGFLFPRGKSPTNAAVG